MKHLARVAYLALTTAGIGISIYDAWEYLTLNFQSCNITSYFSCGGVASSGYTSLFGIPFWVTGLLWFPLALVVGFVVFKYSGETILALFLMIGNIFTIYLWYLELDVIHKICPVCLSLYLINYSMTGLAFWMALDRT
jgi:uncharacterized membrane protein